MCVIGKTMLIHVQQCMKSNNRILFKLINIWASDPGHRFTVVRILITTLFSKNFNFSEFGHK